MSGRGIVRLIAAAFLAALAAAPAALAGSRVLELYPTNRQAADGVWRGVLQVVERQRIIAEFSVAAGEIAAREVLDGRRAIAFVVARFGLSPATDRVIFCPTGQAPVFCTRLPEFGVGLLRREPPLVWP